MAENDNNVIKKETTQNNIYKEKYNSSNIVKLNFYILGFVVIPVIAIISLFYLLNDSSLFWGYEYSGEYYKLHEAIHNHLNLISGYLQSGMFLYAICLFALLIISNLLIILSRFGLEKKLQKLNDKIDEILTK